jgi:hypothetical protein
LLRYYKTYFRKIIITTFIFIFFIIYHSKLFNIAITIAPNAINLRSNNNKNFILDKRVIQPACSGQQPHKGNLGRGETALNGQGEKEG